MGPRSRACATLTTVDAPPAGPGAGVVDDAAPGRIPRAGMRLPAGRRWAGLAIAVVGPPLETAILSTARADLALGSVLLLYLLLVVITAAIGGLGPGILAATASFLLANWFFVPPFHTLTVESQDAVIELVVFLVVAAIVSLTVQLAARERATAARSQVENELLTRFTARPAATLTPEHVLDDVRASFQMDAAVLVRGADPADVIAAVGSRPPGPPTISVPAGDGLALVLYGPAPFAEDRALLQRLATAAARAWEARQLAEEAARARDLAAAERIRSALLAAVGHDLRTPLAGIKAAASSLRADDVVWSPQEQAELLAQIEDGADRLGSIIANLLDLSRLQSGALPARATPVALDEVVASSLLHERGAVVLLEIPDDLPLVRADPGLLERAVANLVDNARRYSPASSPVRVSARVGVETVSLAVVDRGPGVPEEDWPRLFVPFQRLDDRASGSHAGLGLAIARGFVEAMGGTLAPSHTPGGGLTMTLTLPRAPS